MTRIIDLPPGTPLTVKQAETQDKIADDLLGDLKNKVVSVSPSRLRKTADALVEAANDESLSLFDNAAARIGVESSAPGTLVGAIYSHQLANGIDPGGRVQWQSHSKRYSEWKTGRSYRLLKRRRRKTEKRDYHTGIHDLTGNMKRYFEKSGHYIVTNRFGGIKVDINLDRMNEGMKPRVEDSSWGDKYWGLGRITLKVFPKLSPHLMPMLSSRRWYETGGGTLLEREFLPPATADKLSGGQHGPVRPLVLPIVQFYILHRIPGAVYKALKRQFNTTLRTRIEQP